MAITPDQPGFEVTIEVDENALPEYDAVEHERAVDQNDPDAEHDPAVEANDLAAQPMEPVVELNEVDRPQTPQTKPKPVIKYIETSNQDSNFRIRYTQRLPFRAELGIQPEFSIDGNAIIIPIIRESFEKGEETYTCSGDSFAADGYYTQKFTFKKASTDENRRLAGPEEAQKVREWGKIQADFYFVTDTERIQTSAVPRIDYNEDVQFSEKAVHKNRVEDVPKHIASLAAPEQVTNGTVNQVRTIGGQFASFFFFKYRSRKNLQDLGIIPRSPTPTPPRSPTPLHARDPRTMSEDERMEVLLYLQQAQRAIKREREASPETVNGDRDDGDIQWVRTQPAKRGRAMPMAGDEVINVDD